MNRLDVAGRPTGHDAILTSRASTIFELEHVDVAATLKRSNGGAHQPLLANVCYYIILILIALHFEEQVLAKNCHRLCPPGYAQVFLVLAHL